MHAPATIGRRYNLTGKGFHTDLGYVATTAAHLGVDPDIRFIPATTMDALWDGDIEIAVTGLRPGEKLYEELLIGDNPKPTQHARIMKAHEQFLSWPQLEQKLNALSIAMSVNDVPVIRGQLQELVSGYQPSGEVVDWVHMVMDREALANEE